MIIITVFNFELGVLFLFFLQYVHTFGLKMQVVWNGLVY